MRLFTQDNTFVIANGITYLPLEEFILLAPSYKYHEEYSALAYTSGTALQACKDNQTINLPLNEELKWEEGELYIDLILAHDEKLKEQERKEIEEAELLRRKERYPFPSELESFLSFSKKEKEAYLITTPKIREPEVFKKILKVLTDSLLKSTDWAMMEDAEIDDSYKDSIRLYRKELRQYFKDSASKDLLDLPKLPKAPK